MKNSSIEIQWPNGNISNANTGQSWLEVAYNAGVIIPTGCLSGSCGACEIEVNGKTIRACINNVPCSKKNKLNVEFYLDPYW